MPNEPITVTASSDALAKANQWIAERDELLQSAGIVTVVDNDDRLNASGDIQTKIAKHIKALEKERKRHTEPLDKVKKEIMAQEKELRRNLESERARLKKMNDAYATKKAMEAEAARRAAEEEQRRIAMEQAEKQAKAEELFGEGVEVEATVATVPAEPLPPEKVKTDSNRMVKRWSFTVADIRKVPAEFLSLDEAKVRAFVKYQQSQEKDPEVPGLTFTYTMSVESK